MNVTFRDLTLPSGLTIKVNPHQVVHFVAATDDMTTVTFNGAEPLYVTGSIQAVEAALMGTDQASQDKRAEEGLKALAVWDKLGSA